MSEDARFEDGGEKPLNLGGFDADDLAVISSLVQDAVLVLEDTSWRRAERRFALLLNRFRWEDKAPARHGPERVRSMLVFDQVQRVASQGIDPSARDLVVSVLSVDFEPGPEAEAGGNVTLTLAGDGVLRLEVEALEVRLRDVTRPYRAPSGHAPHHDG